MKFLCFLAVATLLLVFTLNDLSLIPYPGIQNDEAYFGVALYQPSNVISVLSVFKHRIPMMYLNYVGTLKTWLYAPILRLWPPSRHSVRLPVLLAGATALLLFFLFFRRAIGQAGALAGLALLATDPIFLLVNLFDWGPVALQFLLTAGGLYFALRFVQCQSRASLWLASLLFGLALWNKLAFLWTFAALLVAALAVFSKELVQTCSRRNLLLAAFWFAIGALPLLRYNVQRPLATFQENAGYSVADLRVKTYIMKWTLDGSGLFGYMVREDPAPRAVQPETGIERFSVALSEATGRPHRTLLPWLAGFSLLLIPCLWRAPARRPMLFATFCWGLIWAQMLFAKGAGEAVHHTVLAWPWPHLLIAAGLMEAGRRFQRLGPALATALLLAGSVSSLLVVNQYRAQFIQNGAARSWTDAIFPLSELLDRIHAKQVILVDWGIVDNLRLLHEGRLPLRWGAAPLLKPVPDENERCEIREMLANPENIFVGHAGEYEQFAGINERLRRVSSDAGFRKELMYVVRDRNGRAVYEVFRFR